MSKMMSWKSLLPILLSIVIVQSSLAQTKPRARDLGIPFDGTPGSKNAITDVSGVEVGYTTLIVGEGKLVPGKGPVRTGLTAILPRGRNSDDPCFAAWFTLNGNGEMTGTTWIEESGFLEGPVMITNTTSVGTVRDAVLAWEMKRHGRDYQPWLLPVVAETWDGGLSDIRGFHVTAQHVFQALDGATSGRIAEGNVGGGTGMVAHAFKAGTGTASRTLDAKSGGYTVGVLVQANYGSRASLRIAGVPVGQEIRDLIPERGNLDDESGSIIVVAATDAPLLPHQLKRMATRISLGIGVVGGRGENSSGDIFIAFSTANPGASHDSGLVNVEMVPNDRMNPLFHAVVQATEEAIVNALVAAETMVGADGKKVYAIPHERLKAVLKKYNRLD